jgi:hypothetical protein
VTAVLDAAVRLLHDHRVSPMLRDIQPLRRPVSGETLELDWADYDRLVSGIVDGTAFEDRAAAPAWPLPLDEREPSPEAYGGWGSPGYERMLADYLRQCVAHFEQRGWIDRNFLWLPTPGPAGWFVRSTAASASRARSRPSRWPPTAGRMIRSST